MMPLMKFERRMLFERFIQALKIPWRAFRRSRWAVRRRVLDVARFVGARTLRFGGPIGRYRCLDSPGAEIVIEGQKIKPAAPGNLRERSRLLQNGRQPWPVFYKRIPQARLVGKSLAVLRGDKRIMAEAIFDFHNSAGYDPSEYYLCLPPATRLEGPWTSVVSHWFCTAHYYYYHWLLDGLPRLALLDRFPAGTRIIMPEPLVKYHRESLEIMGLLDRIRVTPEPHLEVEDYYFSSPTAMTGCDNPYAIEFLRRTFLPAAAELASYPEKIYISRRKASRAPLEEERLSAFLRDKGWTILATEDFSMREQIALFSRARAVCAVHGAGLTNLLWCPPGCRVLELCADNYLNGGYEGLAAYLHLPYHYRVFPADVNWRLKIDFDEVVRAVRALEA
jgi:capsular polysaccharide biosynthesis protein